MKISKDDENEDKDKAMEGSPETTRVDTEGLVPEVSPAIAHRSFTGDPCPTNAHVNCSRDSAPLGDDL